MDFDGTIRLKGTDPSQPVATPRKHPRHASAGSIDGEDPLSDPPPHLSSVNQLNTPSRTANAPSNPSFSVVLSGLPSRNPADSARVMSQNAGPLISSEVPMQGGGGISETTTKGAPSAGTERGMSSVEASTIRSRQPASAGRGRPRGWKPGMRYSEMRGNPPGSRVLRQVKTSAHPSGTMKRRGRPPKQPSPPPVAIYGMLQPDFVAYLCEWSGCKAELHNLDTLRRHIYVVHGKQEKCLWAKCVSKEPPLQAFPNISDFETHIEETHLVPMGWHVGDGPLNHSTETAHSTENEAIPDFLRDKDGQQVTPSVRDQVVEDTETWKNNRRKLKELLKRRDENLPDDESDDNASKIP